MQLQDANAIQLGPDIQRQLVIHMGKFDEVLATAVRDLPLTALTWDVANVLATALYDYYNRFKRTPPFDILRAELSTLLRSSGTVYLHELSLVHLTQTMEAIRSEPESGLDANWAREALRKYLTQFKLASFLQDASTVLQTGIGVDAVVARAAELSTGSHSRSSGVIKTTMTDLSLMVDEVVTRKISTGLPRMDKAIGGGLAPGEMCLIAALQGVGKTNMMLNFAISAAYDGLYNLFLSLEMPAKQLQERVLAMTACIQAMRFRELGYNGLSQEEKARIHAFNSSPIAERLELYDYSAEVCTVETIIDAVEQWIKGLVEQGKGDRIGVVCIDYINFIEVPGLTGDKTNLSPDVVKRIVDRVKKEVANRFSVALYLASQTTSKAEGNKILSRNHVAWGFHSVDAIDFGFGLAPKEDPRFDAYENANSIDGSAPDRDITKSGQELVLSSFKARAGATTAFTFYQAPTLRVYNTQSDYISEESSVKAGEFVPGGVRGRV